MKVRELLELLQGCSPDEEVSFQMRSGCCGDYEYMEVESFDTSDYQSTAEKKAGISRITAQVFFHSLPGYHSCRQVGSTIPADKEYWEHFGKPERARKGPISEGHEDKKK